MAIWVNGVAFDGCRKSDGTLLEAKGPGYQWALLPDGTWRKREQSLIKNYDGGPDMQDQMRRQSIAAGVRMVEWHVAEPRVAAYLRAYAAANHYNNIVVIYDPRN